MNFVVFCLGFLLLLFVEVWAAMVMLSRSTAAPSDHRSSAFGHNLETFAPSSAARFGWKSGFKKKKKKDGKQKKTQNKRKQAQNNCGWLRERAWTVTGST